ncbi:MAG: NAD-glutamate dehydrogenase [Rickettsiales bacterium]|nr:NAD-glutamate dehydrogenase [Rickettsiales bacterium]
MTQDYQKYHERELKRITSALPKSAPALLKAFTHQFYAKVPATDLEHFEPKHALAMAASAYEFFENRIPGEPKIRIFTPTRKEHGYESRTPVIELINNDMPFLVDSLTAELSRQGFIIRETLHPIFRVSRDKKGTITHISAGEEKKAALAAESLIHFEVSALPETLTAEQLQTDLEWVLEYITAAVEDWQAIMAKALENIENVRSAAGLFEPAAVQEAEDFLRWLVNRNFVFMGYAEYDFFDAKGKEKLSAIPGSKLGILKISNDTTFRALESLSPELRHLVLVPQLVEITKSNRRCPVHRPVPMDTIGLKRFDKKGNVIGEARLLGLFTSNVYYQSGEDIPLLRSKIARVLERSDFDPASHDGKALKAIFEFLPRDEVFQMTEDELLQTGMGILALEAKPAVRIFARNDAFERFVSAMVFVPRERFSTDLRHQIQELMEKAFDGTTSSFATQINEAPLARLHLIVKTTQGRIPSVNIAGLEQEIARRAYLWSDLLYAELQKHHGEARAESLQRLYAEAFPKSYINRYDAAAAVYDIGKIEEALTRQSLALELYQNKQEDENILHLKIYNPNEEIALSDVLPLLENAGFRAIEEQPFLITPSASPHVWVRDFKLQAPKNLASKLTIDIAAVKPQLEEALLTIWRREMENDRLNGLILRAGLNWREVVVLRAYAKYLKQIGFAYDHASIEHALNQQPEIARGIVQLFFARFDPAQKKREEAQNALREKIDAQLAQVSNVVEDRILRRYVEIILATLRTNFFQPNKSVLSLKFRSASVPDLPLPRPYAEIFVYGTRVEGIHLRGGKVARGGLRWSDRHEDFRTEVLGLMKAQMVKNSVIVPVGSKGGFVVKHPPAGRDAWMEEGIACYKMYLQGLLDITDNIVNGKVTPPPQAVRHDEDDPYLVVAADKGTASFSDIANSVSAAYGFWLGDAFASGGSAGYDHKKMAITARGAWVSVMRHFREMGMDITRQEFTVAGIGDMAGDVFGNGMLLSENIRLIAAFNHLHIFLDPTPDAAASFEERKRLFDLPRSSWKDYNAALISKGGGIFERSAKTIPVSKEVQAALGITKSSLTPDELIKAILLAPVDLLWNGGIGTYVKAEDETHEQVGDRANNALRVNGRELRCKVVGEGGNLGFTQKGRIEYARNNGRINTDAIDNSAGVDCSDHEVNIKIALAGEMARGTLTAPKRDKLLTAMTEDVARLVLKDNILQTQALTIAESQGHHLLESQTRLIHTLERTGFLDRAIEFLPSDKQLGDLKIAKKGLSRPELAVLLAYSKMVLYKDLLESPLPEEAYFEEDLRRYFPKAMQAQFEGAIARHPLRREIIATVVTNSIVNRAGPTFFFDIAADLGVSVRDIASAYTLARDVFALRDTWKAIEQSEHLSVPVQAEMFAATASFLEGITRWILRNLPLPLDMERARAEMLPGVQEMEKNAAKLHSPATRENAEKRFAQLQSHGVDNALAGKIASLEMLASAFDIIAIAHRTGLAVTEIGKAYFTLGARMRLGWLRLAASGIVATSHWERLAVQALIGDVYDEQRRLTIEVIESGGMEKWQSAHTGDLTRYDSFIEDLGSETPDIPKLMVALRHVRSL